MTTNTHVAVVDASAIDTKSIDAQANNTHYRSIRTVGQKITHIKPAYVQWDKK